MTENQMKYCNHCGVKMHYSAANCPGCGALAAIQVTITPNQHRIAKNGKSKIAAGLLGIFLGALGIHRFYLGYWWGLFYILFCWTFIPLFISIIDFIILLTMDENQFNRKYNSNYNYQNSPNNYYPNSPTHTNITVNSGSSQNGSNNSDEIKKLFALKEQGIITQEEFELKKKILLS